MFFFFFQSNSLLLFSTVTFSASLTVFIFIKKDKKNNQYKETFKKYISFLKKNKTNKQTFDFEGDFLLLESILKINV